MTKVDFCTKLCSNPYAKIEITVDSGEVIQGVVDEIRDDYVVIDELHAFGKMRIVRFEDIFSAELFSEHER